MDKMGSSDRAGNRGNPSSPRDGSAVEIVGLSYSCLRGLWSLHRKGLFSYGAVERMGKDGTLIKWTLDEWAQTIKENFERRFFVREKGKHLPEERRPDLINKAGIYKVGFVDNHILNLSSPDDYFLSACWKTLHYFLPLLSGHLR